MQSQAKHLVLNQHYGSIGAHTSPSRRLKGKSPCFHQFANLEQRNMAPLNWFKLPIQSLWNKNSHEKVLRATNTPDLWRKEGWNKEPTFKERVGPGHQGFLFHSSCRPCLLSWSLKFMCTCSPVSPLSAPADLLLIRGGTSRHLPLQALFGNTHWLVAMKSLRPV